MRGTGLIGTGLSGTGVSGAGPQIAVTDDAFLGEALHVLQPKAGYRAGVDAVLLAAVVGGEGALEVLDAGAGVGVVGLCAARRLAGVRVTLLEREGELVELARQNTVRNLLEDRVTVTSGDVTGKAELLRQAGLREETFDVVLANPPFHAVGDGTASDKPLKAAAHAMARDQLDAWVRFAARMARPGGCFTMIHKADAVADILAAFAQRFGGVKVKPVYPREGEAAIRVIVQGIKGSRAPLEIRPPIVLHGAGHAFTPEITAVLREGAPLAM